MKRLTALTALCAAATAAFAVQMAWASHAAVSVNYRLSSCVPLPSVDEGKVRFFVQLKNAGPASSFPETIRFIWQRIDGSWKDSWINSIAAGELKVSANAGKRYYADFGADPSKPIIRCGIKVGSSDTVHNIRVLR